MTLSMISTASAAPDVCRDLPVSANPGDTITVKLDITMDGADKTIIADSVPTGWSIISASNSGVISPSGNSVDWIDINAAPGATQFTYDVTIPVSAVPGTYGFDGAFDLLTTGPSIHDIVCVDMTMDVIANGPGPADEPNVCRDLPVSANPGDTITVKLDITLDGADKTIIADSVPTGWSIISASNSGVISPSGNSVDWIDINAAPGATQFTYDVTIPVSAVPGTYGFDGAFDLLTTGPSIHDIACVDMTMDVVAGPVSSDEPNVCRDLPVSAVPGETITVILDITLDGADKTIIEDNVPTGWSIISASNGGVISPSGNSVDWIDANVAPGTQVTYDVTIPGDAALGTYDFAGVFDLAVAAPGLQPIDCETQMDVVEVPEEPECPVTEYDPIVIEPCWNFMSVPFALNNSSVEFVLADINYTNLVYWNTSGAIWEIPTDFEPLKAYWIESNESVDQMISSEILDPLTPVVPPTMTVYPGWNAIGYTDSMAILPAELMLGSIDESYMTVIGPYDSATGMYEQVGHNGETGVLSGIHVGTDIFDMGPYEGFWVYVTQEDTLAGF